MPILQCDQRQEITILRNNGLTYQKIHEKTGYTRDQIRYFLRDSVDLTPQKKKTGRRLKLSKRELDELITWIRSSLER
ncbi:hypothetical protein N7456_006951 [Penicillium angulare]|uniref:Uncharacterized protein n=1 Tax=Penicillium angulare TaxID=116970 RepID=A0A9W9FIQ5_9EURO|nr:hypothetical protein N7456_006951 [Penicillium angulare]